MRPPHGRQIFIGADVAKLMAIAPSKPRSRCTFHCRSVSVSLKGHICGIPALIRAVVVILEYFTYPQEQLRHHHIALLTGSVQGGARQPQRQQRPGGEGPAERAIHVLFRAVSQKEQQLWKVALHRCQQETPGQRDIRALARSRGRQWCNKEFLLIFGPDPRLPIFAADAKDRRGETSEHRRLEITADDAESMCLYRAASGAGFRRPIVRPSHMLFTMWLPMARRTSVSSQGRSSRSRERTRDRWVPRFLWIPEHSMHMRAPRFRLAHVGS